MRKGPYPVAYDRTDDFRMTSLEFGNLNPGETSPEIILHLWNKKDFSDAPDAIGIRISALAGNACAGEIVEEKFLQVKSDGVVDPDGKGIIDDAESEFSAIGGSLIDPDCYHEIGDIPVNCARRLIFRLDIPEEFESNGAPRLLLQIGYLSDEVKWLYASEEFE
ncbi:MAG: hypothetical protein ABIC40_08975 [bacterium]